MLFQRSDHGRKAVISAGKGVGIDNRCERLKQLRNVMAEKVAIQFRLSSRVRFWMLWLGDSVASLASRAWQMPVSGNTMSIPLSMDVPYGSGVRAFWAAEGQTHQRSTPNFEINQMYLQKVDSVNSDH